MNIPTFLEISRHSPENCPVYNEKVKKMLLPGINQLEGLLKKHGVKMIGGWSVFTEHLTFIVYEAPSFEALQKFEMEWEEITKSSSYMTTEIKSATSMEEAMKMLK
ncbi:MAG: GYD domain-containing protein [Candidatus Methylarchaceae archaeon HK02M2]|nr:GYD domain-containing protein [Candidatus Methylarchaceae archaeon HK02M2]